ncbi:MAG: hypothetical protein K5929_01185, partial [Lachnospiraceae bacterium]|nr:hypothetical protein [Lachnospiraceae bacterium]
MIKKITGIILALMMTSVLVSCGNTGSAPVSSDPEENTNIGETVEDGTHDTGQSQQSTGTDVSKADTDEPD